MALQEPEVLSTSVVLLGVELLSSEDVLRAFRDSVGTEVIQMEGLAMGLQGATLEPVRKYEIPKDRIILETSKGRSTIQRDYPQESDLPRFCKTVSSALQHEVVQAQSLQACGYNAVMVYEQESGDPAHLYLGHRLFNTEQLEKSGTKLVGGSGQFTLDSAVGRWTVKAEPRFGDDETPKVFMSVNLHRQVSQFPLPEEVKHDIHEVWNMAIEFANRLDEV